MRKETLSLLVVVDHIVQNCEQNAHQKRKNNYEPVDYVEPAFVKVLPSSVL